MSGTSEAYAGLLNDFPFESQIIIWGAAWWGDLTDLGAMLAESPDHIQRPMWDRDEDWLKSQVLISDDGVSRPPDSWALPYSWDWKRSRPVDADPTRSQGAE